MSIAVENKDVDESIKIQIGKDETIVVFKPRLEYELQPGESISFDIELGERIVYPEQ
jgi:hypothetical protein